MINLKIYGTGTANHEMVKKKVQEYLIKAGIDFHIEEEKDINKFIEEKVHQVPAIRVDDKDLLQIEANGRFNTSLRQAIQFILKKEDYGTLTKFVVPTDFSEVSYNAYNYANGLAMDLGGMLVMTHVYFPSSADLNELTVPDVDIEKMHQEKLDSFVKSVNQDWIGEFLLEPIVEGDFRVGFPKSELVEISKQKNVFMIIGSTGAGDAFKKIFGSLSLDLMKNAHCPLFVIPPGSAYKKPKSIIFATENLKTDSNNIYHAASLCRQFGANLKIVHIDKENGSYNTELLTEILEKNFKNLNYSIKIVHADKILDGLTNCLKEESYDIVCFTKKHRNFLAELLHESISEYFAMYADKPLLIFPQE